MRYRIFGQRSGLKVSEIVLGAGMFGGPGATAPSPTKCVASFKATWRQVVTLSTLPTTISTASPERLIGEFVAHNRNDFVIASKFSRGAVANAALAALGANRKAMVQSVEDSLKRLKTDRIDLYFVHMDDGVTPMDEIARGLDDLARAGKIVYTGLSNFPAWRIATAVAIADLRGWTPIAALQAEYSLLQRTTERELLPMAQGTRARRDGMVAAGCGAAHGQVSQGREGARHRFEEQRPPRQPRKERARHRHAYRYRRRDRIQSGPDRHRLGERQGRSSGHWTPHARPAR